MVFADRDATRKALSKPAAFVLLTKGLTLKNELTAEQLRKLISYNPETGELKRIGSATRPDRIGLPAGFPHTNGYSRISVQNKHYYAHRLAWLHIHGKWPNGDIDHINHDKTDNRMRNLRDVSRSVNNQNQVCGQSGGSSKVLGVSWHKDAGKWGASITLNGKAKHLGLFIEKEDARQAYLNAKRAMHVGCTI